MKILGDKDIDRLIPMKDAVQLIEAGFRAKSEGHLVAPPRHWVKFVHGSLGFTIGGDDVDGGSVGFRVYSIFEGDTKSDTQATLVFDSRTGGLEGGVVGDRLGIVRTGAIGGVALKYLANASSEQIGVLGSGPQAWAQLEGAMTQLSIRRVRVFSPTREHRNDFARRAAKTFAIDAKAVETARATVDDSDVVICSTTSATPVLESDWVHPGLHVTTMGRKTKTHHEIDVGIAEKAVLLATDSLAQLRAYPEPHLLEGTPSWDRILELSDIVTGKNRGRTNAAQVTLFLSTGLAGTEVLIAAEALRRSAAR
ncbi:MAG TPA: ornithine cyclodeaminase family protein [Thermoplasmata archaeon]|nr:ornithine cyclodeaminase family protein [Thermoplasmata archaeon]